VGGTAVMTSSNAPPARIEMSFLLFMAIVSACGNYHDVRGTHR
jgi:hypothetical protein